MPSRVSPPVVIRLATRGLLAGLCALAVPAGCRCNNGSDDAPGTPVAATSQAPPPGQDPVWGSFLAPDVARLLVAAELEQDAAAAMAALRDTEGSPVASAGIPGRDRIAWALGRIATTPAITLLRRLLEDTAPSLSPAGLTAAAFLGDALSLQAIPEQREHLERTLRTRYAVTEDDGEAEALLLSLARIGSAESMDAFAADLGVDASIRRRTALLQAIGIACSRGQALSDAGFDRLATTLTTSLGDDGGGSLHERDPRLMSAGFAIARCAASSGEALAGERRFRLVHALAPLATSEAAEADPDAAYWSWRAMAVLGELPEALPSWVLAQEAPVVRVEVAAVEALAQHERGRAHLVNALLRADVSSFSRPRLGVAIAALRALRPAAARQEATLAGLEGLGERLGGSGLPTRDPVVHEERARALLVCEWTLLEGLRNRDLQAVGRCAEGSTLPDEVRDRLGIEGQLELLRVAPKEVAVDWLLDRARQNEAPRTAALALSALAELDAPAVPKVLREALGRDDIGIRTAAAAAIAARAIDKTQRDRETIEPLLELLTALEDPQAVEGKVAVLDALALLGRSDLPNAAPPPWIETRILPLQTDPREVVRKAAWSVVEPYPELRTRFLAAQPPAFVRGFAGAMAALQAQTASASGLRLHTAAGPIEITFADAPAPIAQANLAALANQGFFDGLTFHRVVPGFVVQGGDPRGDGYGGAGYLLPDELSNLKYERGTVGLALAGPDTASSQFFIALSRQPHLDARFPIVGHVVGDDDSVLDALLAGDLIERVEVIP